MLVLLRVRNFAIIDRLELELDRGMNVVTGETGAGKSIMVSALQLVLGARARPEVIRTGADSAEIEALFDVGDSPELRGRLLAMGVLDGAPSGDDPADGGQGHGPAEDVDRELVLRRVIQRNGRSRAYVNGRLASAAQLTHLAAGLADISSQHEHHTLVDASSHMQYLDAFGGLAELRTEVQSAHERLLAAQRALEEASDNTRERVEREDLLRFQVQEIEALALTPGEESSLAEERDRQRHAERLAQLSAGAEDALYAQDDDICSRLSRVCAAVEEAGGLDPQLIPIAEQLSAAQAQLQDGARELGQYARSVSMDPERLHQLEERLHALSRLKRKYGGDVEAILAHAETAKRELSELEHSEERMQALQDEREAAARAAHKVARKLSTQRRKIARGLSERITEELASLSMGDAEVRVEVERAAGRKGELEVDGARLSPHGIDQVEFLIATNRGETPQPLHKIASGGELSRAMLAIKRVLAGVGPGGLYVFDEVDAGVGGAVAEVIGRKVQEVSEHHQVLCITHLPQIAVFGDRHFHVHKAVEGGRTKSHIDRLSERQRREEIARMLGGIKITDKTRAAAGEMLQAAVRA
ncbi:MAG: DNA repair protein RecN [Myxococcales bacterium]|nr:DNA repair protein RecN [Myxococcales bacterium]